MPNALQTELRRVWGALDLANKELRALRLWRQQVGSGTGLRASQIIGVIQPGSGGTGGAAGASEGNVSIWINGAGATLHEGDIVVTDLSSDALVHASGYAGDTSVVGVVIDASVAAGQPVRVRHGGYSPKVAVVGTVSAGYPLRTSGTPLKAERAEIWPDSMGTFAIALTADVGGFVSAYLLSRPFNPNDQRHIISGPVLPAIGTFSSQTLPDVVTAFVGEITVPSPIFFMPTMFLTYDVTTPATGAGAVVRAALYDQFGGKIAEGTDALGTNSGLRTITLTPVVVSQPTLVEGPCYLFICLSTAAALTQPLIKFWNTDDTFNVLASYATICGKLTIIGGAAPATFNTNTDITATPNCTPYVRISSY